jgi:hypothetical protein
VGSAVVKTVAECDHHARIVPRNDGGEAAERRHRVIGWQQHAARGEAGTFFQMQVGNDEQALLLPEQCAGKIGDERHVRYCDLRSAHLLIASRRLHPCRHVLPHRLFDEFIGGFRQQLIRRFAIN